MPLFPRVGWRGAPALLLISILALAPRAALAQGNLMFATKGVSDKPESKLWYNDGSWWACINNATKMAIYKLDGTTWTWKLDVQNAVTPILKGGSDDALWDGTNLFIAAYDYTTSKIYKFTYNPVTQNYALVAGFPVNIAMRPGSETIVIDKDSTGRLWLTYEGETNIYVQWSTSADHKTWVSTTLAIGSGVDPDDISTIVAFGGNKIGVCWSDQVGTKVAFRVHRDTDAPTVWQTTEVIRSGFGVVDDHINIKADSQGRVFLAGKDFFDSVWIGRRNVDGTWTLTTGASGLDCGTRPILQIDEAENKLYVFYTRWETCVSSGNHAIEERVAYLDNLMFSLPTVVISAPLTAMNEVQGTKQILPAGCMAILCEGNLKAYWAGWGTLSNIGGSDPGGSFPPPPEPPTALAGGLVTETPQTRLVLWRMEDGTGTKANDTSGNGHVLNFPSGTNTPHWATGVNGGGLFFDGHNYASTDGSAFNFVGQSFTLETWLKVDKTNSISEGDIFARADTVQSNYQLSLNNETLKFSWSVSDTAQTSVKATGTLRDNAWHHVAAVYDASAGEGRLYIDGFKKGAKLMPAPALNKNWTLYVGALISGTNTGKFFDGSLDQMAISDQALYNADFIPPLLYPATTTKYLRLTWTQATSTAGISGCLIGRGVNGYDPTDLLLTPTPNKFFIDMTPPDGNLTYFVRSVDGLTQQGSPVSFSMTYESTPPAVPSAPLALAWSAGTATADGPAFWELDEGSGDAASDGTGLGHTMQLGAAAGADASDPLWNWGLSSKGLTFDGTNDHAQVADASDLRFTTSFTIETWVRRAKLNAVQALINKDAGSSKRNYGMTILANGTVEFSWSKTSGSLRKTTSTSAITDMEWHHIAGVYNSAAGTNTIYIDGAAAGSSAVSGTVYTGPEPILLGARTPAAPADFLKGDMDLVRISKGLRYTGPFTPPTFYRGGPQRHVVRLNWSLPATGLVNNYNIYRQPLPSGSATLLGNVSVGNPTFTDVGVTMGLSYRYTIKARNSANVESAASAPLDVTVPDPTDVTSQNPPAVRGPRLRVEPNPFNPQATVRFQLQAGGPVMLELYDARGRKLDTLVQATLPAGEHQVRLLRPESSLRLSSGVYFLRLRAEGQEMRIKAVLVK